MRRTKRILVWLLTMGLLLTSLTGCDDYVEPVEDVFDAVVDVMEEAVSEREEDEKPTPTPEEPTPAPEEPTPEPTAEPTQEPTPEPTPEPTATPKPDRNTAVVPDSFPVYTLSEEDIAAFEAQLLLCETMLQDGVSYEEMEEAADELDRLTADIQNQATLAEVLYYCDMQEEELVDNYLFSAEVSTEITAEYIGFLVDLYDSGAYEEYFSDWLEIELAYLETFSDETTELEIRNSEILAEFHDMQGDFEDGLGALYTEFVSNSNQIAVMQGYANYYDFASTFSYKRDYGKEEREQYRQYVKEYIIPLYNASYFWYEEAYYALSRSEKKIVDALVMKDYDSLSQDYVNDYFESLPEEYRADMQHMFVEETFVITDNKDALEGAFTVDLQSPYCYFGPGYQDAFTLIHEIGHYYADLNKDTSWLSFDLCEVHSQGNEMLFLNYLETVLEPEVFEALEAYRLYAFLNTIVQATLMDDFEERVYSISFEKEYTTADFDEIMYEVIDSYGIDESDSYTYACMEWLWRNVAISSPVYYLSYGISAMASLSIYSQCVEDPEAGVAAYFAIQEASEPENGFMSIMEMAGVSGVFEEETYEKLTELFGNE